MNKPREPVPKELVRPRLVLATALSLLILGWMCWGAYNDYRDVQAELPAIARMQLLRGEIVHLDAVLTMSARMAAASGDLAWETHYREFEAQLAQSIKDSSRLAPDASHGDAVAKISTASAALVAVEHRVFDLVREGNNAGAQRLLSSEEHEVSKDIYGSALRDFDSHVLRAVASTHAGVLGDARQTVIATVVAALSLILGSWLVFRVMNRWHEAVVKSNEDSNLKTAELKALNDQLDRKVGERTKELRESVLASMNMMEDAVRQRENAEQAYVELEQTQGQLVEASRQRGMAEVATNVLHNVGNVLNSVNVSANLVVERISSSRAESMAKVVALLREHAGDLGSYITSDPKGRHIPAFLEQLSQDWLDQQAAVAKELESLRSNIDHIKEIVMMQQNHAKVLGYPEIVNVRDLVEDSLRMNEDSLIKHQVRVVREFEEVPPISVEKHKVLQILVNLMRNAKDACDDLADAQKRMTLRIMQLGDRIRISVSDNGAGIAPENLTRIFAHGFTTRKDGHGFGLHSGALAASELGGSLSAHSEGPGKGATFTLELGHQPPGVLT